jgi:hypothetical protein
VTVRLQAVLAHAHGLRPVEPVGVIIMTDGRRLRIGETGEVDEVLPGGHPRPGIAADPAARRA